LNLNKQKRLIAKSSILIFTLLIIAIFFTGCVQGMAPVGWSGIAVNEGVAFTGSKEGRLVRINLANNSIQFAEPLKTPSSGGSSCTSSGGGGLGGSACGGSTPAVAIYGTPAIASVPVFGNLVYVAGYNGKVFAYDANNLQQRWVYPVDGNLSPIISTLVISGNNLYFGCLDNNVYALDISTGALIWKFTTGGEIWSSPAIDNNTVYIASFDKKIYALDAATGAKKWDFTTGATNVATPVTFAGIVYFGSLDRNLYALNQANGEMVWKKSANNWFWAKPVIVDGVIYAPSLDNFVYAFEAKTGKEIASYDTGGQIASWPVVAGNKVVVATKNGKLFSLDTANPTAPPNQVTLIPEDVTAPLTSVNNVIYINGTNNSIYAYDIVTGAKMPPISLKSQ
jgi:outer membrane protein assembly factor BamB